VATFFSLQQIVNGLQLGSIYALIALGYTMVYGIVRLINFAHGDFFMFGAYAAYGAFFMFNALLSSYIAPGNLLLILVLVVAMAAGAGVAMLSNRMAYKRLRYKSKLSTLVAAIGVSMFLEYFFSAFPAIGPSPRGFPEVLPKVMWKVGSAQISNYVVIDLVVAAALMTGLTFLVQKTPLGRAMRAVAQDKDAAKLMGIHVEGIITFTFLIGGAFAGAAGLLAGLTYPRIMPYMGIMPGLKAFISAVLGGIGNIPGAMLGAYIMGLVETTANIYNSLLGEGIAFVILILVLLVRPTGILGEKTADKI
jgi:branched-chain amino acid transport system permease protein